MITQEMAALIRTNTIAMVATVTPEGRPAVSPKATVVVLDKTHIAFTNLRSPGTLHNISVNPAVELNFIDVFRRKAVRLAGQASYTSRGSDRYNVLLPQLAFWSDYEPRMRGVFEVTVEKAEMVLSPAYDRGARECDLVDEWFERYRALIKGA